MTPLRQRMTEDMQVRNLALNTQTSLRATGLAVCTPLQQITGAIGPGGHSGLSGLPDQREESWRLGSVLIAVAALRFLYKVSLKKDWTFEDVIPAPKKPQKLPVVLSPEEVLQFLDCVGSIKHRAILTTCYAAGCASPRLSA